MLYKTRTHVDALETQVSLLQMRVDSLEQQLATAQNIQSIILTTLTSSSNNTNSNNNNNNISSLQTLGVTANNLTAAVPQIQNQQRAGLTGSPTHQLPSNFYLRPSNAVGNMNNNNNNNNMNGINSNTNAMTNVSALTNSNNNSGISGLASNGYGMLNANQILLSQLSPSASHHSSITAANNNVNNNNNNNNNMNSLSCKLDEAAILAAAK